MTSELFRLSPSPRQAFGSYLWVSMLTILSQLVRVLSINAFVVPKHSWRSSVVFASASSSAATPSSSCLASVRSASTTMTSSIELLQETSPSFKTLLTKLKANTQLQRVQAVMGYDQLVSMPQAASEERGHQLGALASLVHEKTTDPELKKLIEESFKDAEESKDGAADSDAKRLLELERRAIEENERVSPELAAKAASLGSTAHAAWATAREKDDFPAFAPVLKDCFDTAMEISTAKRGDKDKTLYSQMLDEYEVGMPEERIQEVFGSIEKALVPLIQKVLESSYQPSTEPLKGTYSVDDQKKVGKEIVTQLGFDVNFGRIDVSVHPFTTSMSPKDVRITSRYRDDEWSQGLAGLVHECGHAMYEQNLLASATQLDSALSMGTHESQSLFWERHVGLSLPFWNWAFPKLQETFPTEFEGVTARQVYEAVNAVSPSLIRVEADELTYPLHVIMRYRIERDVIGGTLEVSDIAKRWKEDMKSLLNVNVPNDKEGCLQDVHWSALAFGYFPTYLIGSATAAQLCHYCRQDLPDFDELIEKGEFGSIKEWLINKVHKHGKRYESLDALLEAQVGEKLNPEYFIRYLTEKYSELYKL